MKALILAAGYATRLYPLTKDFPKPLLKIKNKPIIDYILGKITSIREINEIFVVTNSKFFPVFKTWSRKVKARRKITLINDLTKSNEDRLGAMGDIGFVLDKKHIKEDLLIVGGDNLFDGSLNDFIKFAKSKTPSVTIGVYRLKNIKDATRYGVVKISKESKIIDFHEKPEKPNSSLVAMCLYYLPYSGLKFIKDYMRIAKKNDATGRYIDWIKDRVDTYSFVFSGKWYDIGDYKYLNSAKKSFA